MIDIILFVYCVFLLLVIFLPCLYFASIVIHLICNEVYGSTPVSSVSLDYVAVLAYSEYSKKVKSNPSLFSGKFPELRPYT